ncbi:MAG TPA: glutamate--tRNA ligase, partial [Candidatus Brocadiales bacterium]|nr:glutamate--tRNA ligase [Candidatus Brocadiales bacterium]
KNIYMANDSIRVRFPPSPTGFLHIGGARTALYNWLFAKHHKGKFVLRLEDTDRARSTDEAVESILESMKWLGLDWDEGPFFQSKRLDIYKEYVEKLLKEGKAYYSEDAEKGRAVRFKMAEGITKIDDMIHGGITFDASLIEDFVILKADGFPTYNFACVVDDCTMGITHVIRGDDHISNTPKQVALYHALGFELPKFGHIPMILGEDGTRLSKRHGATSVTEYREKGYLPEAVINFIALLGWSPGGNQEFLTRDEMIEKFSLERVGTTPARFNTTKLDWMNSHYIKHTSAEALIEKLKPFLTKAGINTVKLSIPWLKKLVELYRERFKTLEDFVVQTRFLFFDDMEYDEAAVEKFIKKDGVSNLLKEAYAELSNLDGFEIEKLEACLRILTEKYKIGFGKLAQPLRVAITGKSVSAGIFETMELLGKEKTIKRLEYSVKHLCTN